MNYEMPELPDNIEQWVNERFPHYMFYDRKRVYSYCTSCRATVDPRYMMHNGKHFEKTTCPVCGAEVEYLCLGRFGHPTMARTYMRDDVLQFLIMQNIPGAIVIRRFEVHRKCIKAGCGASVDLGYIELQRRINDGEDPQNLRNVTIWGSDIDNWKPSKKQSYNQTNSMGNWKEIPEFIYKENIEEALRKSPLKYAKCDQDFDYYAGWIKPCEYLEKAGLNNLAWGMITGRRKGLRFKTGKNVASFLGVSKEDLKKVIEYDMGFGELDALKKLRKLGIKNIDFKKLSRLENFIDLIREQFDRRNLPFDFLEVYEYARKNSEMYDYGYYGDYIRACEELKYKINHDVLFPPDLKKAHDRETKRVADLKKEQQNKEAAKKLAEIAELTFCAMGFMIRPPKLAEEIIREGHELKHCVGSYVDRVAKGDTAILFLRKEEDPDNPFYTIEWNKGIKQLRGDHNAPPTPEVAKFAEKFEKWAKKRKVAVC